MMRRLCRCGHPYDAHQHYSRSGHCSLCDWCILYQPRRWWRRGKHPAAGTDIPHAPPPGHTPAGGEPPAFPPAGDGSHLPGPGFFLLADPITGDINAMRPCGCVAVRRRHAQRTDFHPCRTHHPRTARS